MKIQIKKYSKLLMIFNLVVILQSCDDFVNVDAPSSQLTTPAVFEDALTATVALTDIYAKMRENGFLSGRPNGFTCLAGTYSDDLVSYEIGNNTSESFFNNSLLSTTANINTLWRNSYSQIYAANAVIEGVNNSNNLSESVKNQVKGEALFIRAFLHFHLMSVFGDIPYIKTTDYIANSTVERISTELVFQHLISDLEDAANWVNTSYIDSGRTRPNKNAIQAFLARVYLYQGDYTEASNMASAVLNETTLYQLENNLDEEFLKQSSSTIWQLSPGAAGANTYEGNSFIFFTGPPTRFSLNPNLFAQFESNDLRKTHWIKSITNGSQVWYHSFKYKKDIATSTSMEHSIILRLSEQYLIRAEARAKQGDLIGAIEDLNVIRQRAGLSNTTAVTTDQVLSAILQERRLELFTELGHRFLDLKRLELLDSVLGTKPGWSTNDKLWPLPQAEMDANPFLVPQNPGY
ncbi:RagB/SusD family nutrient uptake outer membrane protein [Flavobacterium sp. 102]|uniref:RagB/SusD family nutrient uptake outer membrane protein n=1 Tax=Flavobacterium sp. 102 TaxID=2135623 RepID=UPI000EB4EB75|nr:RagB/SusD family nutrient uptake outer membrane protein [Flavobacterium sp. 102]RKS03046.1 SusD-like starch-binding protein associating with outer membrane [Flavobacterium sp. 102]